MLVGYVSDERYLALHDVAVVFERGGDMIATRSLANGAILADIQPGPYRVSLAKDGFGAKRVERLLEQCYGETAAQICDKLLRQAYDFGNHPWSRIQDFLNSRTPRHREDLTAVALVRR